MYVYRDPDLAADAQDQEKRDAAYWYDLSGEQDAPVLRETRGPFEPLVPSSGQPPHQAPPGASGPDPAASGTAAPDADGAAEPRKEPGGDGQEDTAHARVRKLDQIKDLYLTAEAIGEENVGKHFDQLMAQQRALISDYFKQSAAAKPAAADEHGGAAEDQADPGQPGTEGEQQAGSSPDGAGVAAEQPRAW